MQSKQQLLDKIASNPAGTLRDIEILKKQLMAERLIGDSQNGVANYFASIAQDYQRKYWFCKKRLIRSRILVKALKQAAQGSQERRHSDFSAD